MKTINVNGVQLAVADEGLGQPVLLIHGFPMDHSMWESQLAILTERWRVIAPDLRGFGASGVTSGKVTIAQYADDLAALLDALEVNEPVVLVGLSMGGYIAFQFYRKYQQRLRGLVLCDTRSVPDTPEAATARLQTADRVEREGAQVLAESMAPKMLSPGTFQSRPEVVELLRRMILAGNPVGLAAAARGLAERPDFTPLLAEIDCPTLVVVGKDDAISPPQEMATIARAIRGSKLVEIEAAGHVSPLERPAEVNSAMLDFIHAIGSD
jgi:3-oxoadipate enol-lactonase